MHKNINVYMHSAYNRTFSFEKKGMLHIKKGCIEYCKILENVEVFTPCKN